MTQCIAELQRNGNNLNEIEPESLESVGFHRDSEGDSENHNLKLYMNRSISQGVYLSPGDSLFRAVNLLKQVGNGLTTSLPVLDEFGRLIGRFDNAILPELLSATNSDTILQEPIARWISPLDFVANPDTLYEDVVQYFATGHESTVYFADYSGRYIGSISIGDVLVPNPTPIRPAPVGGMATPFGVYLTNGSIQAGANNFALVSTGVVMSICMWSAVAAVALLSLGLERYTSMPVLNLWNATQPAFNNILSGNGIGWYVLHLLPVLLFLAFMRIIPLAGYHAAEHQAVHAMERDEPLFIDVVRRMPRVHPRCGTNIMAGAFIFLSISEVLPAMQIGIDRADGTVLGALFTLFTWRRFGSFLQQNFTTRPASDKQLLSGIKAAQEIEKKYMTAPYGRVNLCRRIWCMGLVQVIIGASGTSWILARLFGNSLSIPF